MSEHETQQDWYSELPIEMPLVASEAEENDGIIRYLLRSNPHWRGTVIEAIAWLRIGRIARAHEIVQDASRGIEAYVHGVVHRLEGDYWNANYWFRQVRDKDLVQSVRSRMIELFPNNPAVSHFDPQQFVSECEAYLSKQPNSKASLQTIDEHAVFVATALAEWNALWQIANVE